MFGGAKVKVDKDLWRLICRYAKVAGYASPEEFVTHVLERELAPLKEAESDEELKKKLKGLGYIS